MLRFVAVPHRQGPAVHVFNSSLVDAMKKPPIYYGANTASACLLNNQSFHGVTLYCTRIYSIQKKNTGSNRKSRIKGGNGEGRREGRGRRERERGREKERKKEQEEAGTWE